MNIIEKSSNGISQVSADAKLMSNRKVFIEGEINAESACEFVKKIMILNMQCILRLDSATFSEIQST